MDQKEAMTMTTNRHSPNNWRVYLVVEAKGTVMETLEERRLEAERRKKKKRTKRDANVESTGVGDLLWLDRYFAL